MDDKITAQELDSMLDNAHRDTEIRPKRGIKIMKHKGRRFRHQINYATKTDHVHLLFVPSAVRRRARAKYLLKIAVACALVYLLSLWIPPSAFANPGYRPAYDQTEAQQDAMAFRASNAGIYCTTCAATFQAWKAAELAKAVAQCEKDYAKLPEKAAKCTAAWQTFLN
jgi:hypothetical protein